MTHELAAINRTVLLGVSLFLLLVSLLRAGIAAAQQYIAVEQTAVDDVADIPDPGTLGIDAGAVIRRAIVLLPTEEKPQWIRDAIFDFKLRAYEFERHSSAASSDEALAVGGEAMFETGHIANLVRIGAGYHFSKGIDTPPPPDATGLIAVDGGGISVLSSAFVKLGHDDRLAAWLGRHSFNLPYLNRNDSRMVPFTHEAYVIGRIGTDFDWSFAHFAKVKPWASEEFVSMSEAAGAIGTDEGVSAAATDITIGKDTNVFLLALYGWDTFSTYYAEGNWWTPGLADRNLRFGTQYARQASVGKELLGKFDTSQFGVKVTAGFGSLHTRLSYTQSSRSAELRNPWGGNPHYNDMMLEGFARPGERAWRLAVSLTGTPWGRPAWSGDVSIGHGYDARREQSLVELPSVNEVNITIDYRPQSGPLNGLWWRVRYAESESSDDIRRRNLRLILNYALPVL